MDATCIISVVFHKKKCVDHGMLKDLVIRNGLTSLIQIRAAELLRQLIKHDRLLSLTPLLERYG